MTTQHLFGRLFRFLNQPLFVSKSRVSKRPAVGQKPVMRSAPQFHDSARMPDSKMDKVTLPMPLRAETAIQVPASEPVATTQAMRTLEEVRSDLARLREHTTRRREAARREHAAHLRSMREAAQSDFAPTDLQAISLSLDIPDTPEPRRQRAASASGFMPTDFLDIPVIRQP